MAITARLAYAPRDILAQALGFDTPALFGDDGHASVQLNGARLHLQHYHEDNVDGLLLFAELGTLPSSVQAQAHRLMLLANTGWREVAGGALGTDESGAQAILRLRLDLFQYSAEDLVQWLYAFIDVSEHWAEQLAALTEEPVQQLPSADAQPDHPQTFEAPGTLPFNLA